MDWQMIQQSFRGSFEGAVWLLILLVMAALLLPVLWHVATRQLGERRRLGRIRRRLQAQGLSSDDWRLVESAIAATCPGQPHRLLENVSLFHAWLDSLPELDQSPQLQARLGRIKELAYPDTPHVFIPHSTRDLVAGTSLNLVLHQTGQEATPCLVTEAGMQGLRLARRGTAPFRGKPGDRASLFYPRPEAMYHAIVDLREVGEGHLLTSHCAPGNFKVRQLREFWRVDLDMELAYHVLAEAGATHEAGLRSAPEARQGRLINLSGNGTAIVTTSPPPRGSIIVFTLHLPSRTLHEVQGEVLHVTTNREFSRLHVVFRNLDPGDQELIIRNLFLLYREQAGMEPLVDSGPVVVQNRT
jgi:hypothetical protein